MLNHLATASTSVYNLITSWAFFSFILDALVIFIEQYLFRLDAKHLYYLKWFLILTFAILPFIFIGLLYRAVLDRCAHRDVVHVSNLKIDVFDDFWVKNRVGTSFEPENRCFRRFFTHIYRGPPCTKLLPRSKSYRNPILHETRLPPSRKHNHP